MATSGAAALIKGYTQTSGILNWNDGNDANKTFSINPCSAGVGLQPAP
jgi:hypothetical protein